MYLLPQSPFIKQTSSKFPRPEEVFNDSDSDDDDDDDDDGARIKRHKADRVRRF